MTKEETNQYLDELERQLLNEAKQIAMSVNTAWVNQFPNEAAVYIFRQDDTIAYVGETKNLNALMIKLVSVKSVDDDMGSLLHDIIAKNLKLSYLLVGLGRKELEERILKKISANKKTYTKAEKQQTHKNAYERWSTEDDEKLELLFCEGKTVKELSVIFARNEGSTKAEGRIP